MEQVVTAWERTQAARDFSHTNSLEFIKGIFHPFIELHGDRAYGDDAAIVGGIGFIDGIAVTVIGQQKGKNPKENIKRNYGMPKPEGYRKALRLMKQAEKFHRPIICFVDTPGAFCGIDAEERGQGQAIANNIFEMSSLTVPVLSIVIGEGGSGGALAMAVANEVWMVKNSIYSILSPEGFAAILWKDHKRAKEAAEVMKITPKDLKSLQIIDYIVDYESKELENTTEISFLKQKLLDFIKRYEEMSEEEIVTRRYERFRRL